MKNKHTQFGFTLMELIVAITITMIILILVGRMFFDSSQAMQRGIALSDVITDVRGVSSQMKNDFKEMVGPQPEEGEDQPGLGGGVLIITQRMVQFAPDGTPGPGPDSGVELNKPFGHPEEEYRVSPKTIYRPVRSDQIVFIRHRGDLSPITPAGEDTFAAPLDTNGNGSPTAQYVRIWYGHIKRTEFTGDNSTDVFGHPDSTLNGVASNWMLGRQALFFGESYFQNSTDTVPLAELPWAHAHGARHDAEVHEFGTFAPEEPENALYSGLTDYAYYSLSDPAGQAAPADAAAQHPIGAMVGNDESVHTAANDSVPPSRLWASLSATAYHNRAVANYTFAQQMLQGNPVPGNNDMSAWQIAQMHPILIEHVSDFIVEFAGDYENNATKTTKTPDGKLDVDAKGNIKWYTLVDPNPTGANGEPVTYPFVNPTAANNYEISRTGVADTDASFVWRHDDQENSKVADTTNQHSLWPYLIRIRYRIHDSRGILSSGDNWHGVWFEQIFAVKRPRPAE